MRIGKAQLQTVRDEMQTLRSWFWCTAGYAGSIVYFFQFDDREEVLYNLQHPTLHVERGSSVLHFQSGNSGLMQNIRNEEMVHVCIAAGRRGVIKELSIMLTSMFLHAQSQDLFLHFLVDKESEEEIVYFMSSTRSLLVNVSYEVVLLNEDFIINETLKFKTVITHHSGVFGMSKLFFYQIWKGVEKCIILDTDLIFARDPAELWEEFHKMSDQSVIMMRVESEAHRCNSGVMLQRFQMMRELNFDQYFSKGVTKYCTPLKDNQELFNCGGHGDQNIFHQIFLQFPQLYTQISKSWNIEYCQEYFHYNFNWKKQSVPNSFFGIAHFNCLPGDDYLTELRKKEDQNWVLIKYIEYVNKINTTNFQLGNGNVKRILRIPGGKI